jgi:hypothetical protein
LSREYKNPGGQEFFVKICMQIGRSSFRLTCSLDDTSAFALKSSLASTSLSEGQWSTSVGNAAALHWIRESGGCAINGGGLNLLSAE